MGQAALTQGSSTSLWLSGHQQGPPASPAIPVPPFEEFSGDFWHEVWP